MLMAAAQSVPATVDMPNHFRGRYECRLATRRDESKLVTLWIDRGLMSNKPAKGSIEEFEAAGVAAVRDVAASEVNTVTQGRTSVTEWSFRSGAARIEVREYRQGSGYSRAFVTVVHDPDEANGVEYETATGFCSAVHPMPLMRQSQ